jgi:hypothetical protein
MEEIDRLTSIMPEDRWIVVNYEDFEDDVERIREFTGYEDFELEKRK